MKLILKLYHVIIALLYHKILNNLTKIVYLSSSRAVIISLIPYHIFTDDNMDLAWIVHVEGNLDKGFPPQPCTSWTQCIDWTTICLCQDEFWPK